MLEKALTARPKELDVTMEGLMQGGVAILGMSLRAIGVGAAQGMSEWRDHKGFKLLMTYVDEPRNNERVAHGCVRGARLGRGEGRTSSRSRRRSSSTPVRRSRISSGARASSRR